MKLHKTAKLVKLWKENIYLLEPNFSFEVWFTIRKKLPKYAGEKTKKQFTEKLRNLTDLWKKANENNYTSEAFLETFFAKNLMRAGSCDVVNMPQLKQVHAAEKSSCNLFDGMESTTQKH